MDGDGGVGVGVLHAGCCQHACCRLAISGDAWTWQGGSCAHLIGRVVLTRSHRRHRRVHEYVVLRGVRRGQQLLRRRALHDPIVLTIVVIGGEKS
eukprot:scaffold82699_cov35-Tisochrysis_lutea.AAC.1